MFTEMIGFVIIILVMIVVIIRRQLAKNKVGSENFDDSASQLQMQLEEAADIIIKRVENQVNHLELLIREADEKIIALDDKLKQIEALDKSERAIAFDEDLKFTKRAEVNFSNKEKRIIVPLKEESIKKIEIKPTKINKMVFEMLDHGNTIDGIAKQTGLGKGAILLLKELYNSKKAD